MTQAAAALAAVTGVGAGAAAVFEAIANAILIAMTLNVLKQVKRYGAILSGAAAAVGTLTGLIGSVMELELPSLNGNYDHPGVA
ncbi:hypothetical protein ACFWUP_18365 [Nocardia sp. NPDC058658]|uniref:hypothetical protein n=1 Tax=Nocardia sp. NPDC058658 TaxID=3346580 RepID=UPI0036489691